jgi:hypothetical protein
MSNKKNAVAVKAMEEKEMLQMAIKAMGEKRILRIINAVKEERGIKVVIPLDVLLGLIEDHKIDTLARWREDFKEVLESMFFCHQAQSEFIHAFFPEITKIDFEKGKVYLTLEYNTDLDDPEMDLNLDQLKRIRDQFPLRKENGEFRWGRIVFDDDNYIVEIKLTN